MSITQTVEIPASHRLTLTVPREVPEGRVVLTFTPAVDPGPEDIAEAEAAFAAGKPCPLCARHTDPETGELRYNAQTIAAIAEGDAIERGEIPAKRYRSVDEFWEDLDL